MDRAARLLALQGEMHSCRRCLDAGFAVTPGAVFSGGAGARVMIVGQAPGSNESRTGIPFCGPSGRRLFRWLAEAGWDEAELRGGHYITAVTKCFPGKGVSGRGDRAPSAAERALCSSFLDAELELVDPAVVVPVGGVAIRRFLGAGALENFVGQTFTVGGRAVVPLPHPSGANAWLQRAPSRRLLARAIERLRALDGL